VQRDLPFFIHAVRKAGGIGGDAGEQAGGS
jgi:hypothetical protein